VPFGVFAAKSVVLAAWEFGQSGGKSVLFWQYDNGAGKQKTGLRQ
jgi:hypothetical protein